MAFLIIQSAQIFRSPRGLHYLPLNAARQLLRVRLHRVFCSRYRSGRLEVKDHLYRIFAFPYPNSPGLPRKDACHYAGSVSHIRFRCVAKSFFPSSSLCETRNVDMLNPTSWNLHRKPFYISGRFSLPDSWSLLN
jgi:hypothetical protein